MMGSSFRRVACHGVLVAWASSSAKSFRAMWVLEKSSASSGAGIGCKVWAMCLLALLERLGQRWIFAGDAELRNDPSRDPIFDSASKGHRETLTGRGLGQSTGYASKCRQK